LPYNLQRLKLPSQCSSLLPPRVPLIFIYYLVPINSAKISGAYATRILLY
jgi:hypothetical protein